MKRSVMGVLLFLSTLLFVAPAAHADTSDFKFSNYEVDYYLGSDQEARSTLKTVEKITAEFPAGDQNHGIERAIPKRYDGHTTSLRIDSVTDEKGANINYTTYDSGDNEVLQIGDKDTYVHDKHTYVLTYSQRDVTKYYADTGKDEFYWDTNGTGWGQTFDMLTARLHLSDSITPTFTKEAACYQGVEGSTKQCTITTSGNTVEASAANLGRHQTMTVALGFTPGTWRGYEPSLWDKAVAAWQISLIATSLIGVGMIVWIVRKNSRVTSRSNEMGTIIAEYLPPKEVSVLTSSQIISGTKTDVTAQIIDLAVRHYLKLYQVSEKSIWKQAEYELEIIKSTEDLRREEKLFLQTLLGGDAVGTRVNMKTLKNNYTVAAQLVKNKKVLTGLIRSEYGLETKNLTEAKQFSRIGWALFIISVLSVSPVVFVASITAFVCGWQLYVVTDSGLSLRRYLEGLKLYIGVAETERLKMLQSPQGAEKVGNSATDTKQLVKLYERVLPYAVLFGQEKEWNKQLGIYYEQADAQPDWYSGTSAFNAVVFSSALSDFNSTMNSYSASSSSTSGGSGGGGYSGGGGGGGGGGGW